MADILDLVKSQKAQSFAAGETLIHEGLEEGSPLTQEFTVGWARITSGLKTLLETGESLVLG